jgi:transcriptional regulator with XRE-family HTH domain
MAVRRDLVREAERQARRQVDDAIRELRNARLAAGLRQSVVAKALGISRQLLSTWELGRVLPDPLQFARWGAVVGRDVRLAVYSAGSALRDSAHVDLLTRARGAIAGPWTWRTEVPVSTEPLDRRAIDVVLTAAGMRIGLELVTRLIDAQALIRQANLKLEAGRLAHMILVLSDTAHNREAVRAAGAYLKDSYPLESRAVLAALRAGQLTAASGAIFV